MIARQTRTELRPLDEVTRLIEQYPESWRRWCSAPENGGCACLGCVRQPAPSTVRGDPEYARWPNEADALTEAEVNLYHAQGQRP
jgi:hypothetical protein